MAHLRARLTGGVMVAWAVLIAGAFFLGWDPRWTLFRVQLPALAIVVCILATAGILGRTTAERLQLRLAADDSPSRGPLLLLLGFGTLSWLWLWLGVVGLLRAPIAWLLLVAGLVWAALSAWAAREPTGRLLVLPERGRVSLVLVGIAAAVGLPLLLTPPASTDELVYHLAVPQQWVEAGRLTLPPEHFTHAAFPLQVDLLYAWVLLLGAPAAAKLVHCAISLTGLLLAARLAGRELGREAAWGAAAFLLTLPVALTNFSWAVIDGALAAFILAGCCLLARAGRGTGSRDLLAAGLFWGFALATKYTAGLYLLVALPVFLAPWGSPLRALRQRWRGLISFAALVVAIVAPWWVRSTLVHGDPLHPFGARLLGLDNGVRLAEMTGESAGWLSKLGGLLTDTLGHGPADEHLGFLPLVLVPLMLLRWGALSVMARRLLVVGTTTWLLFAIGAAGSARFVLPAMLLLAVPAGECLALWWKAGGRSSLAASLLLLAAALPNLSLVAWQTRELFDPLKVMLGVESQEHWLERTERGHATIAFANATLPEDAKIVALWSTRLFWLEPETIVSGPADAPWIHDRIRETGSLEALVADLHRRGVTHLLFDAADFQERVLEGPSRADWSDAELEVLHALLKGHAELLFGEGRVALYALP